ncbi:hypothetical protein A2W32_02170 [candidate division WWE3 bacterium RBG_16_37_10]|uniref:HAMP domain-containing protein n=1 Tax=candidate division WWE3 bacterium RBG_16_37_10 TaxID=1802610 RepID=A0A1F4V2E6_UNCKA|nr:MAG: hypothetical protein A2W32_02170 [candidate division WWE3 bacterium RBG_16_37_10]
MKLGIRKRITLFILFISVIAVFLASLTIKLIVETQINELGKVYLANYLVFFLTLLVVIVIGLFSIYLESTIVKPLKALLADVVRVRNDKNFDARVRNEGVDEVYVLSMEINKMLDTLKSASNILSDTNKELKEKTDELEKINKIMVGRELKMISLKKEIEKLKGIKQDG